MASKAAALGRLRTFALTYGCVKNRFLLNLDHVWILSRFLKLLGGHSKLFIVGAIDLFVIWKDVFEEILDFGLFFFVFEEIGCILDSHYFLRLQKDAHSHVAHPPIPRNSKLGLGLLTVIFIINRLYVFRLNNHALALRSNHGFPWLWGRHRQPVNPQVCVDDL